MNMNQKHSQESQHSHDPQDIAWMKDAIAQAELAVTHGEVPIGCVLVSDGERVGVGETSVARLGPSAHGENTMLTEIGSGVWGLAHPLTLYTNVEPCLMCLGACVEAGIDRIVYGVNAPLDGGAWAAAGVAERGRSVPTLVAGVLADQTYALLKQYIQTNAGSQGAGYVRTLLQTGSR